MFSKYNATIATLRDNYLLVSCLSLAIRAFFVVTYCHLMPRFQESQREL